MNYNILSPFLPPPPPPPPSFPGSHQFSIGDATENTTKSDGRSDVGKEDEDDGGQDLYGEGIFDITPVLWVASLGVQYQPMERSVGGRVREGGKMK